MKCCDCLSLSIHKEDFWTCKLLLLVKKLTFLEQVWLGFLCSCPSIFDRKSQGIQFFSISGSILLHNFQNYNEEEAFGAKNRFLTRAIQSFTITFALGSLPHWRTRTIRGGASLRMLVRLNLQNNSQPPSPSASQPLSLLAPQLPSPSAF